MTLINYGFVRDENYRLLGIKLSSSHSLDNVGILSKFSNVDTIEILKLQPFLFWSY